MSNVTVGGDGPPSPGDYVAITIRGRGEWQDGSAWTPEPGATLWSADLDAAAREASAAFGYLRRLEPDEGSITVFVPRSRQADPPAALG